MKIEVHNDQGEILRVVSTGEELSATFKELAGEAGGPLDRRYQEKVLERMAENANDLLRKTRLA